MAYILSVLNVALCHGGYGRVGQTASTSKGAICPAVFSSLCLLYMVVEIVCVGESDNSRFFLQTGWRKDYLHEGLLRYMQERQAPPGTDGFPSLPRTREISYVYAIKQPNVVRIVATPAANGVSTTFSFPLKLSTLRLVLRKVLGPAWLCLHKPALPAF